MQPLRSKAQENSNVDYEIPIINSFQLLLKILLYNDKKQKIKNKILKFFSKNYILEHHGPEKVDLSPRELDNEDIPAKTITLIDEILSLVQHTNRCMRLQDQSLQSILRVFHNVTDGAKNSKNRQKLSKNNFLSCILKSMRKSFDETNIKYCIKILKSHMFDNFELKTLKNVSIWLSAELIMLCDGIGDDKSGSLTGIQYDSLTCLQNLTTYESYRTTIGNNNKLLAKLLSIIENNSKIYLNSNSSQNNHNNQNNTHTIKKKKEINKISAYVIERAVGILMNTSLEYITINTLLLSNNNDAIRRIFNNLGNLTVSLKINKMDIVDNEEGLEAYKRHQTIQQRALATIAHIFNTSNSSSGSGNIHIAEKEKKKHLFKQIESIDILSNCGTIDKCIECIIELVETSLINDEQNLKIELSDAEILKYAIQVLGVLSFLSPHIAKKYISKNVKLQQYLVKICNINMKVILNHKTEFTAVKRHERLCVSAKEALIANSMLAIGHAAKHGGKDSRQRFIKFIAYQH